MTDRFPKTFPQNPAMFPTAVNLPESNPIQEVVDAHTVALEKEIEELRRSTMQFKKGWTLFIFDCYQEGNFEQSYFLLEGDYSRYEGVFINWGGEDQTESDFNKEERLYELILDTKGFFKRPSLEKAKWVEAIRQGAIVVNCGYCELVEEEGGEE